MPRRTISGRISAALPSRPTDTALPSAWLRFDHRERLVEVEACSSR
jgi:hypothetical protein